MIIESEPNGMLMVRYKFYFNQAFADPEDQWVLDYIEEHHLEPRRVLHEEHEGVPFSLYHFGQCYLARHISEIGKLYQKGVKHSALANRIMSILEESSGPGVREALQTLEEIPRYKAVMELAMQLYEHADFETSDDQQQLAVAIDTDVVLAAFRTTGIAGNG